MTLKCRSKRRLFALATAGAAGAGAAYLAYKWYYASTEPEADQFQQLQDDEPSTSGHRREVETPLLVDPRGTNGAPQLDAEAHLQHHFDSIQEIADGTTLPSLLPALSRAVSAAAEVDATLEKLRGGQDEINSQPLSAAEKLALWESLKTEALAELLAACWALPLLDLLVRVQLNVLGRHLYLETALAAKRQLPGTGLPPPPRLSAPSQEQFLSYSEHLAKEGHIQLLEVARRAAQATIGSVSLQTPIDVPTLNTILSQSMELLELERWGDHILPPPLRIRDSLAVRRPDDRAMLPGADAMLVDGPAVESLVSEVARIVSSQRFHDVAVVCAKHVVHVAAGRLNQEIAAAAGATLPLARVVPLITNEARKVLALPARGEEAVYLGGLSQLDDVKALCATVYSCGPPL